MDDSSSFITSNGSHYVTYEQALRQAIQFLSSDDEESIVTRANRFVVEDHYEYVSPVATRSLSNTNFTPSRFHVINFAYNGGFAVVAADNRATPIYAYSDEG
ncbi:MAG: Spi family protease inhibitor [Bacteroidaceae bacterium]|nr:Spi family protease inhibitor [Bacteroidaceae bacterium]